MTGNLNRFTMNCDSSSVVNWVNNRLDERKLNKVTGIHEYLIKRRLDIICDLISLYSLVVQVVWIPSHKNKADGLTRVRKIFNRKKMQMTCCMTNAEIRESHDRHHFGVERTLFYVMKKDATVTKQAVKSVVQVMSEMLYN